MIDHAGREGVMMLNKVAGKISVRLEHVSKDPKESSPECGTASANALTRDCTRSD